MYSKFVRKLLFRVKWEGAMEGGVREPYQDLELIILL